MWRKEVLFCTTTFTCYCIFHWLKHFSAKQDIDETSNISQNNVEPPSYFYLPQNAESDLYESNGSAWFSRRRVTTPLYWKLLMMTKSENWSDRRKAVQLLSEIPKLEDWQYMMIAQACDARSSIGLARMPETKATFFLLPPFKDLGDGDLQQELSVILASLPLPENDLCLQNLVEEAKIFANELADNREIWDISTEEPASIFHSEQKRKSVCMFHKLCLLTFLGHSAIKNHRQFMIKHGILKLLLKLLKFHGEDVEIQSMVAQILANFSLEETCINDIYAAGWVGILSRWAKSPSIEISLPSVKALANLDRDDHQDSLYEENVYLLHPQFRHNYNLSADVIFIHGLRGATFWTWRQNDSEKKGKGACMEIETKQSLTMDHTFQYYTYCWPKDWLSVDFPTIRVISVDYRTSISNWRSKCPQEKEKHSLYNKAKDLTEKLLLANVGERPIIWVTHSMGGLLVKQMLVESSESNEKKKSQLFQKTAGIVFYSVPHKGTELASIFNSASYLFQPSVDITQLQKGSHALLSLHEKFRDIVLKRNIPVLSYGETKKSRWGLNSIILVPLDSADPGFGEFYALPVDHLSTCKPESRNSIIYSKLLEFLQVNLPVQHAQSCHMQSSREVVFEIYKIMCLIP